MKAKKVKKVKGYSIIAKSSYFKTFLTRERFLPFSLCHILVTVQFKKKKIIVQKKALCVK